MNVPHCYIVCTVQCLSCIIFMISLYCLVRSSCRARQIRYLLSIYWSLKRRKES